MKINRRMSIGAILGGIFGGPSVAKEISNNGLGALVESAGKPSKYAYETLKMDANSVESMQNRIKYLQKIANGELLPWQLDHINDHGDIHSHMFKSLESLKSISNATKIDMKNDIVRKYKKQHFIDEAIKELKELMKFK